jgi:hypothetical protein
MLIVESSQTPRQGETNLTSRLMGCTLLSVWNENVLANEYIHKTDIFPV